MGTWGNGIATWGNSSASCTNKKIFCVLLSLLHVSQGLVAIAKRIEKPPIPVEVNGSDDIRIAYLLHFCTP